MNDKTSKNEAASQGDREESAGFLTSEAGTVGRPEKEPQALKPARTTPENGETVKQPAPKKPEQKTKLEQKPQTLEDAAKPQNRGLFRSVVGLYGVAIIAYAVWQVMAGTQAAPDSAAVAVNPSIESNYAFLAAVYAGVGIAFLFIARKFKWANMLVLACLVVFLGGVGRIISWASHGTPHWSLIVLMVTDLVIPPCLLVWYAWINKSNTIRQQMLSASRV